MTPRWLAAGSRGLAVVRIALGALFVYAAATKIPALDRFAEEIANYRVLPARLVAPMAAVVPGIELLAGVLLVANRWTRAAASLTALMLAVFTAAISQALVRGINLECGCFGGAELATWWTVARDVALLLGTLFVAASGGRPDAPGQIALNSGSASGKT